jgi:hypothetical protein
LCAGDWTELLTEPSVGYQDFDFTDPDWGDYARRFYHAALP